MCVTLVKGERYICQKQCVAGWKEDIMYDDDISYKGCIRFVAPII